MHNLEVYKEFLLPMFINSDVWDTNANLHKRHSWGLPFQHHALGSFSLFKIYSCTVALKSTVLTIENSKLILTCGMHLIKRRDIILSTKVHLVKAMVFSEVMYGCESWTIKKGEYQRIDAFKLWCWRRLLRVPWRARRSSQLVLKEISPEYSLEELMLKL